MLAAIRVSKEKKRRKQKITANNLLFKMSPQTKYMKKSNAKKATSIIIQIMNSFLAEEHKQSKEKTHPKREDICKTSQELVSRICK